MIKVGIAGIGFMGVTHFKAWSLAENAMVRAISSRSSKKLTGEWNDIQGNFGGKGGHVDLSDIAKYHDYAEMIADDELDLIDICLPTPVHEETAVAALEAGKHVIVEKPIALTVDAADRMIAAARANGRQLMVAQVLRFWPQWVKLKEAVASGTYGKLLAINLRRVIAGPDWSTPAPPTNPNGGPMIDLHIHDVDFMLYLLGKPRSVFASGIKRGDAVQYVTAQYDYGDGPIASCQSGAIAARARPFQQQFEAYFENATMSYTRSTEPAHVEVGAYQSASQVLTVYSRSGEVTFPAVEGTDGFLPQLQHAAQCVRAGRESTIIGATSARDALALVHLEAQSLAQGRPVCVA